MKHFILLSVLVVWGATACSGASSNNSVTQEDPSVTPPPDEGGSNVDEDDPTEEEVGFCQLNSLLNSWPEQRLTSSLNSQLYNVSGTSRDQLVLDEVEDGNSFPLKDRVAEITIKSNNIQISFCVFKDYLALNNQDQQIRFPLGMTKLEDIISQSDWTLPTAKMVDIIYQESEVKLAPQTIPPSASMGSTTTIVNHSNMVNGRLSVDKKLVGGHKKDIVMSNRLSTRPDRIAIYGWHQLSGNPIQPLSTVHHKDYADYSHGVRFIYKKVLVNNEVKTLGSVLSDSNLASLLSHEGVLDRGLISRFY